MGAVSGLHRNGQLERIGRRANVGLCPAVAVAGTAREGRAVASIASQTLASERVKSLSVVGLSLHSAAQLAAVWGVEVRCSEKEQKKATTRRTKKGQQTCHGEAALTKPTQTKGTSILLR